MSVRNVLNMCTYMYPADSLNTCNLACILHHSVYRLIVGVLTVAALHSNTTDRAGNEAYEYVDVMERVIKLNCYSIPRHHFMFATKTHADTQSVFMP